VAGQPLPPKPNPPSPQPQAPSGPEGGSKDPATLFNGMLAPVIPYGIKGAIWYQGESNANQSKQYRTLFPAMIAVSFKHVGGGLVAKDGELKGFTIAGEDKQFVPAQAKIQGANIIVSAEGVAAPKAVRYGWANVPDVNLFNQEGLPASPFRTDVD
jgi:hypothetical protein